MTSMTAVLSALTKEKHHAQDMDVKVPDLFCSEGHVLCSFIPPVDGWCCEECGGGLEEGLECLRCHECDGLTFCYPCVGSAELQQFWPKVVSKAHNQGGSTEHGCSAQANYASKQEPKPLGTAAQPDSVTCKSRSHHVDDFDLVVALSLSEAFVGDAGGQAQPSSISSSHESCYVDDLKLATALSRLEESACGFNDSCSVLWFASSVEDCRDADELIVSAAAAHSLEHTKRCYVCGRHTLNPLKLDDPECMHVACTLECLHKLHSQWLDLTYELCELDNNFPYQNL